MWFSSNPAASANADWVSGPKYEGPNSWSLLTQENRMTLNILEPFCGIGFTKSMNRWTHEHVASLCVYVLFFLCFSYVPQLLPGRLVG